MAAILAGCTTDASISNELPGNLKDVGKAPDGTLSETTQVNPTDLEALQGFLNAKPNVTDEQVAEFLAEMELAYRLANEANITADKAAGEAFEAEEAARAAAHEAEEETALQATLEALQAFVAKAEAKRQELAELGAKLVLGAPIPEAERPDLAGAPSVDPTERTLAPETSTPAPVNESTEG